LTRDEFSDTTGKGRGGGEGFGTSSAFVADASLAAWADVRGEAATQKMIQASALARRLKWIIGWIRQPSSNETTAKARTLDSRDQIARRRPYGGAQYEQRRGFDHVVDGKFAPFERWSALRSPA
jgi:hypothetical protein